MRRLLLPFLGFLAQTACFYSDGPNTVTTLDYHIDRPRIIGLSTYPQVFQHGTPVTYNALIVGPDGTEPESVSVDLCGLLDDQITEIYGTECFKEPEYITHVADSVPFVWEPPDQSGIGCDDDPEENWWTCTSMVPLLFRADFEKESAYAIFNMPVHANPATSEVVDLPIVSLTATGDIVAGGDVELRAESTLAPEYAWRWYVDAGELRGTGRTLDNTGEGPLVSENTLTIPEDWSGTLRVFVVVQAWGGDGLAEGWSELALEVP